MGTLFRRTVRRPVPQSATIIEKNGQTLARWRSRGKLHSAPVTEADGMRTVTVETGTYYARYRDHTGHTVERSTGCRDETNARQKLAKWEKEAEQVRAGVFEAGELDTARAASDPIDPHIDAYLQSLIVAEVSDVYRTNADRAIRRLCNELKLEALRDLCRDKVEPWFAKAISEEMGAANRNYFRQSILSFANWLTETKRIRQHDLAAMPVADRRLDPRRQRRALTPDEITRLLAVAASRPLDDARTVRTGDRKGERGADLRPEVVERLRAVGRERVLIYRTLIYTGLRAGELRTLTVARLDLTPGTECIQLEAANEKNRAGSTIPLRSDLAADLRAWIAEKRLGATARLFTVPAGLRRILDRDMKAAGIPKRDERGRTVDVHAMRTTFATMLSTSGTAPRTAQAAMRHSDIKLTMGVYTDPKLLDVRQAVEKLPKFGPPLAAESAHDCAGTSDPKGQFPAPADTMGPMTGRLNEERAKCENAGNVSEKPSVTIFVTEGHQVERRRVELPTSSLRTKRSTN
jgi:integrase